MSGIDGSITGLVAARQGAIRSAVGFAVAAKQLDAQEQQGQAVVRLLETAVELSREPGKGGRVDSHA